MKNMQKQPTAPVPSTVNTCVQPNKHQYPSRQTPVSDTTDTSVHQPPSVPTKTCVCCHRELPTGAFYVKNKQQAFDSHCKECRKAATRAKRKEEKWKLEVNDLPPAYPVITRMQQREARIKLILSALQTVRKSIERRSRRRYQEES